MMPGTGRFSSGVGSGIGMFGRAEEDDWSEFGEQ